MGAMYIGPENLQNFGRGRGFSVYSCAWWGLAPLIVLCGVFLELHVSSHPTTTPLLKFSVFSHHKLRTSTGTRTWQEISTSLSKPQLKATGVSYNHIDMHGLLGRGWCGAREKLYFSFLTACYPGIELFGDVCMWLKPN